MAVTDAAVLTGQVDGTVLVIRHGGVPNAMAQQAKSLLENANGRILGVVLNRILSPRGDTSITIISMVKRSRTMIDLHTHILPGIDDGPPDLETAVAMARYGQENGLTAVAATPILTP